MNHHSLTEVQRRFVDSFPCVRVKLFWYEEPAKMSRQSENHILRAKCRILRQISAFFPSFHCTNYNVWQLKGSSSTGLNVLYSQGALSVPVCGTSFSRRCRVVDENSTRPPPPPPPPHTHTHTYTSLSLSPKSAWKLFPAAYTDQFINYKWLPLWLEVFICIFLSWILNFKAGRRHTQTQKRAVEGTSKLLRLHVWFAYIYAIWADENQPWPR